MAVQQWKDEADIYKRLLITETSDVHFGVGIQGNNSLELIPHTKDSLRALDIGCGSGENVIALSSLGYSVVGIDSSERQIDLSKSLLNSIELPNAPVFMTLPAERIEAVEGEFSIILSVGVLHFCSDLPSVINNIASKLTKGGKAILSLPHPIDMISDYSELDSDVEIKFTSYFPSGHEIRGARYWSKFGGASPSGYEFSEYYYTICGVINSIISAGLRLDAFLEPICDHKDTHPCRFSTPSEHFVRYYSPRVPQYAIYVASKES